MDTKTVFAAVCAAAAIIMLIYYSKRPNKVISVLFGGLTGAASLILLCRYGGTVGIDAVFNLYNLAGSLILGIPYVISITIMNFL